ncbi:biotin/lipoyl-containing protein [candidate division KSB1 bacterium]
MEEVFVYKNKVFNMDLCNSDKDTIVSVNEKSYKIATLSEADNELVMEIDGERCRFFVSSDKDDYYVFFNGRQYHFRKQAEGASAGAGASVSGAGDYISSPMPGTIIKINCTEGDEVRENDTLVIVEAMKMENNLRSPIDGKIVKINYSEGDLVDAGTPIVEIDNE